MTEERRRDICLIIDTLLKEQSSARFSIDEPNLKVEFSFLDTNPKAGK